MSMNPYPGRVSFGLLPEPEGRSGSFITAAIINTMILALVLYIGMMAKHVIEQHHFEQTDLVFPTTPPPQPKVKMPPPPKLPDLPKPAEVKLETPKINLPKPEPRPAIKPIEMEAKVKMPEMKAVKPAIILAPQPKAALTAAAPAQTAQLHPSTAPVHLGQTFGVTPNPNATRPANRSGHRQSLWRHAGASRGTARRGGLHGHRQRHALGLEFRRGGQSCFGPEFPVEPEQRRAAA